MKRGEIERPLAAMCSSCLEGPQEIAGHDGLVLASEGPSRTAIYHCTGCHALWAREYTGSGHFAWTAVAPPEVESA